MGLPSTPANDVRFFELGWAHAQLAWQWRQVRLTSNRDLVAAAVRIASHARTLGSTLDDDNHKIREHFDRLCIEMPGICDSLWFAEGRSCANSELISRWGDPDCSLSDWEDEAPDTASNDIAQTRKVVCPIPRIHPRRTLLFDLGVAIAEGLYPANVAPVTVDMREGSTSATNLGNAGQSRAELRRKQVGAPRLRLQSPNVLSIIAHQAGQIVPGEAWTENVKYLWAELQLGTAPEDDLKSARDPEAAIPARAKAIKGIREQALKRIRGRQHIRGKNNASSNHKEKRPGRPSSLENDLQLLQEFRTFEGETIAAFARHKKMRPSTVSKAIKRAKAAESIGKKTARSSTRGKV